MSVRGDELLVLNVSCFFFCGGVLAAGCDALVSAGVSEQKGGWLTVDESSVAMVYVTRGGSERTPVRFPQPALVALVAMRSATEGLLVLTLMCLQVFRLEVFFQTTRGSEESVRGGGG